MDETLFNKAAFGKVWFGETRFIETEISETEIDELDSPKLSRWNASLSVKQDFAKLKSTIQELIGEISIDNTVNKRRR